MKHGRNDIVISVVLPVLPRSPGQEAGAWSDAALGARSSLCGSRVLTSSSAKEAVRPQPRGLLGLRGQLAELLHRAWHTRGPANLCFCTNRWQSSRGNPATS